jgi:hypothetical protein
MNKGRNKQADASTSAELDRLVLREMQAVRRKWLKKQPGKSLEDCFDICDKEPNTSKQRNRVLQTCIPDVDKTESTENGHDKSSQRQNGSGFQDESGSVPVPDCATEWREASFGENEEGFIQNAVEWLNPRKDKDAIVARIWTLLTESDPQAFYSPLPEAITPEGKATASQTGDEGPRQP